MKLESVVILTDNRRWKIMDVEHVYQHPNTLPIYTLRSGPDEIRLTANELQANRKA